MAPMLELRRVLVASATLIVAGSLWLAWSGRPAPPSWLRVHGAPAVPEGGLRPSGALRSLDFWGAARVYPGKELPEAAFGAALAELRSRSANFGDVDSRVGPWRALGPANVGGRTLCLALHPADPDVIFAGSASGGLWKSTSGGRGPAAWSYVDTGYPVLGVSSIAIEPNDPSVMYIGTGEAYSYGRSIGGEVARTTRGSYGVGILKSSDAGLTWAPSLDWTYALSRGVWRIEIHPADASILYAATTEGIYKSGDRGMTWALVHGVVMAMDVRVHPTDPDTIIASHGDLGSAGVGLYRSTDAGQSWSQLRTGLPATWSGKAQIAISPVNPDIVYASIADAGRGLGLYRSTNRGSDWSLLNGTDVPQYQGWYAHYVLPSPFDANTLFTAGIEIHRSLDGGSTLTTQSDWTEVFMSTSPPEGPIGGPRYAHADHHFAVWHPSDPRTVFFASDGGIFRSTDLGNSFESLIGGYQTSQFYNGFSNSPSDVDFAMGGLQDNFTVAYQGTGAWRRVIGGDGCWTAQHPTNPAILYGSAQYLLIVRSDDGGDNWTDISPPNQSGDATAFVAPFVLCPDEPTVLYAGRSRVYRSNDEGRNWAATNGGASLDGANPVLALAVAKTTAAIAYAGTAPIASRARVFTTRDGGASWRDVTGALPDRYPSDLAVDPNDPLTVYVTFLGFGTSHLFKSTDGGDNWLDIGGSLPDIPTSAVEVDPVLPQVVYVGTDLGAFVSSDGGASFTPFTNGMPIGMVNDLKVFLPGRTIRAATHGNGAWERSLFRPGILRADVPQPLPRIADAILPWTDPEPVLTAASPPLLFYQVEQVDRILMHKSAASVAIVE